MTAGESSVLCGWGVVLQPLGMGHVHGLMAASADGDIWRLKATSAPEPTVEAVCAYIARALEGQAAGNMQPYAVLNEDNQVVGTTRYYDIDTEVPNRSIGYTWYGKSVQRTHVNTACKRLLLGHAFQDLGCQAVYFHTSHINMDSRAAIERLGAKLDGVVRNHKRHKDGSLRDTYFYSITAQEWPAVRLALDARLSR